MNILNTNKLVIPMIQHIYNTLIDDHYYDRIRQTGIYYTTPTYKRMMLYITDYNKQAHKLLTQLKTNEEYI